MTSLDLEQELRTALTEQATLTPESSIRVVRDAGYAPRTVGPRARFGTGGVALAALAAGAFAVWTHPARAPGAPPSTRQETRVAYIGNSPRIAVTRLPHGFHPGPRIPIPTLPGEPAQPGLLPSKTFVKGVGASRPTIVVAEGRNGVGPVPKLLHFAAAHRAITSTEIRSGRKMRVVDLRAVDAGSSAVVYFRVAGSSWVLVSGSESIPTRDLLLVAAGIRVAKA